MRNTTDELCLFILAAFYVHFWFCGQSFDFLSFKFLLCGTRISYGWELADRDNVLRLTGWRSRGQLRISRYWFTPSILESLLVVELTAYIIWLYSCERLGDESGGGVIPPIGGSWARTRPPLFCPRWNNQPPQWSPITSNALLCNKHTINTSSLVKMLTLLLDRQIW